MTYADTIAAFLRQIIAHPADDGPRLTFADWCEEHGQGERAEYIRTACELATRKHGPQCNLRAAGVRASPCVCEIEPLRRRAAELLAQHEAEWVWRELQLPGAISWSGAGYSTVIGRPAKLKLTWHRGFIHQVECQLETWRGLPCPEQYGEGWHKSPDYVSDKWVCPTCHGVGRVGGIGQLLVRRAPIEAVVVTDRKPVMSRHGFSWFGPHHHQTADPGRLPADVWHRLDHVDYPSADTANAALSSVLLQEARETPLTEQKEKVYS